MTKARSSTTAVLELMSRGQPLKSTNWVRGAHTEFVAALAGNAPAPNSAFACRGPNTGSALALSRQAVVAPQIGRAGQADASPTP